MRLNVNQPLLDITDEPMQVLAPDQQITQETKREDLEYEEITFAQIAIRALVSTPEQVDRNQKLDPEEKIAVIDLARRIYRAQQEDGIVDIEVKDPRRILDAVDRLYPSPLIYAEMKRIINEMATPLKKKDE